MQVFNKICSVGGGESTFVRWYEIPNETRELEILTGYFENEISGQRLSNTVPHELN